MIAIISEPQERTLSRATSSYKILMTTSTGVAFGGHSSGVSLSMPEQSFLAFFKFGIIVTAPNGIVTTVYFTAKDVVSLIDDIPIHDPTNGLRGFIDLTSYFVGAVVPKMNAHPLLTPFITVSSSPNVNGEPTLIATLHHDLVGYQVAFTAANDWSNSFQTAIAAISDPKPVNARVRYDIYFEASYNLGQFELVYEGSLLPDTEGVCLVSDLSDILHGHCISSKSGASLIALKPPFSVVNGNNLRRYYVVFAEAYGSPVVVHQSIRTTVKTVLMGGMSRSFNSVNFFSQLAAIGHLSFLPNYQTACLGAPLFFNFMNVSSEAVKISLKIVTVSQTGVTALTYFIDQTPTIGAWETVCIPIDPITLDLLPQMVARYSVQIVKQTQHTVPYSTIRNYTIDRVVSPDERVLAWRNGFGGLETLRVRGVHQSGSTMTRKEAVLNNRQEAFNVVWKPSFTYRTGPITAAQRDWLTEMFLAGSIFEVLADGYVPLFVTSTAVTETAVDDNLMSLDIKAVPVDVDVPFSTESIFTQQDWAVRGSSDGVRRFMVGF